MVDFRKIYIIWGCFRGVLKIMQINGVFKKELSAIIYGLDFLGNRKDIDNIWIKVSEAVLKNKFPNINSIILNDVKTLYLPVKVSYYENYTRVIEISYVDRNKEYVMVKQTSKFTVHPLDTKEPFKHRNINTIKFGDDKFYSCCIKISQLMELM